MLDFVASFPYDWVINARVAALSGDSSISKADAEVERVLCGRWCEYLAYFISARWIFQIC